MPLFAAHLAFPVGDPRRRANFIDEMKARHGSLHAENPERFYRVVLDLVHRNPQACGLSPAAVV